tara:strand:+ start:1073 stop:2671 length:1599 start_codon:yes stop_codon:yes gene_type:complete
MPSDKPVRVVFSTEAPRGEGGKFASHPTPSTTGSTSEIQAAEQEQKILGYLQQLGKFEREGGPEQPTVGGGEFGTWVETSPEGEPLGQSKAAKDWRRRQAEEEAQRAALTSFTSQFAQPVSAPEIRTKPVTPVAAPEPVAPVAATTSSESNRPILADTEHNQEVRRRRWQAKKIERQEILRDFHSAEEAESRGISADEMLGIIASNTRDLAETEKKEEIRDTSKPQSMTLQEQAMEAMLSVHADTKTPGDTLIPETDIPMIDGVPVEGKDYYGLAPPSKKGKEKKDKDIKPVSFGGGSVLSQIGQQAGDLATQKGFAGFAGKTALKVMALGMAAAAATKGLIKLNSFLAASAEEIKAFAPEIMVEQVQRSLMVLEKRMERAREVGPMLAEREKAATGVQDAIEDLKTDVIKLTTPFMTGVLRFVSTGLRELHDALDGQAVKKLERQEAKWAFLYSFGGFTAKELKHLREIRKELREARMAAARLKHGEVPHMNRVMTLLSGWEQGQFGMARAAKGGGPRLPNLHQPTRPPGP